MRYPLLTTLTLGATLIGLSFSVYAGKDCNNKLVSKDVLESGLIMAEKTKNALDQTGEKLVILARKGSDLSKYGVEYSHLAFAFKDVSGHWRVVHKLNECSSAYSGIYKQGLAEFYLDNLWKQEGGFVVPTPELQERIYRTITNANLVKLMHEPKYSMVSYPWATKYQQSNQWALETMALASNNRLDDRQQAQAWLRDHKYRPDTFKIGPLTRLAGRITSANIEFDDHPDSKRFASKIETSSVDAIFRWMQQESMVGEVHVIK